MYYSCSEGILITISPLSFVGNKTWFLSCSCTLYILLCLKETQLRKVEPTDVLVDKCNSSVWLHLFYIIYCKPTPKFRWASSNKNTVDHPVSARSDRSYPLPLHYREFIICAEAQSLTTYRGDTIDDCGSKETSSLAYRGYK